MISDDLLHRATRLGGESHKGNLNILEKVSLSDIRNMLLEAKQPKFAQIYAPQSFRHVNGFDRLTIGMSTDCGPRLRMHVWNSAGNKTSSIHNHTWAFVSTVLKGSLMNERFTLVDDLEGQSLLEIPNRQQSKMGANVRRSTTTFKAISTGRECVGEGESYCILDGEYHRSVPCEENTITLVLQGEHVARASFVVGAVLDAGVVGPTPFRLTEYLDRMDAILQTMG